MFHPVFFAEEAMEDEQRAAERFGKEGTAHWAENERRKDEKTKRQERESIALEQEKDEKDAAAKQIMGAGKFWYEDWAYGRELFEGKRCCDPTTTVSFHYMHGQMHSHHEARRRWMPEHFP
jgi:hypothetical protein